MKSFQAWLEQKYTDWEKGQSGNQSYYTFARFLDVGHSSLALWISGTATPSGDDLAKIASKLGQDVFDVLSMPRPNSPAARLMAGFPYLPSAFQARLSSAVSETSQSIIQKKLDPESSEAKLLAASIFEKWGFKITS
jgi:hypothetical protein